MRIIMLFLLLVVFLIGVLFTSVNTNAVAIDYYLGVREMPLAVALLIALIVGVVLGLLTGVTVSLKYRNQLRVSNRQVKKLNQELENLRALPVRDSN